MHFEKLHWYFYLRVYVLSAKLMSHLINIFNCFWLFFFNQNGMETLLLLLLWNFNYKSQWKLITCSMKGTLYDLFPSRERYTLNQFFLVSSPFWTRSVSCCNPLFSLNILPRFSFQLPVALKEVRSGLWSFLQGMLLYMKVEFKCGA